MSLIANQQLSGTRAEAWNAALVVAEAGIEEALAHLNSGVTTNDLAQNSWADMGGGVYEKTNSLGDSYSVVDIKISPAVTNADPVVVAKAYVPGPISRPKLTRTLQVNTKPKPIMSVPGGMVVTTTINLKGSGIAMDSFDSSDPNLSTGGMYDPKKARDHAHATTISSATNAIEVDNGTIKGFVHTGPGGVITVGSGGAVGDSAWVSQKKPGLQSGHSSDDANFTVPDVQLPSGQTWVTPTPGKYKINGVSYKYVLNNQSAWKISKLTGNIYISSPDVILYVSDVLNLGSGEGFKIAAGGSVSLYVGAKTASLGGNGVMNDGGLAKNFTYYGLSSNVEFTLGANASFTGSIVAPNAAFTLGGGGSDIYDFVGGCIVKSVTMNGHFNYHYDESLATVSQAKGFTVIAWDEL